MADEQFHFANNKWDVKKIEKKKKRRENKETNKRQKQNTKIRTVTRKQSKQIVVEKTKHALLP